MIILARDGEPMAGLAVGPYLPWLRADFRCTKSTLFESGWDWTRQVVQAIEQVRADYYRLPAYGIMLASLSTFALPMLKGAKPIKAGMREWADYIRTENTKKLASLR